ncbi:Ribonuclease P protein subunit p30 [Frankliniella fusca]|uniref:Ribonuclease P protein subunit p30 n=1 Tax=Frankliniella fusca TaxID=407009 RepID=A0AAE1L8M5_9NEOP|nr:Ribonuclease P protein subunit p30 [Frankliniella fusca]
MRQKNGFYDLSITAVSKPSLVNILSTLIDFGYRTVAINQIVEESAFETSDKKKKRKADKDAPSPIPPPISLDDIPQEIRNSLQILHRVTVCFSTSDVAHKMVSSENFKKYDIVAVIPTSKAALQHTCNALDVDIISVDISNKMSVRWNRKLYNMAVDKGMWFELPYALAVLDSSARRNLIEAGHLYHAFGKSKNILLSSGAENPMQIRGPYDVINMSLLLGLSEEQAKSALTNAGKSVLLRAESRRRGKSVVVIARSDFKDEILKETKDEEMEESHSGPILKKICKEET